MVTAPARPASGRFRTRAIRGDGPGMATERRRPGQVANRRRRPPVPLGLAEVVQRVVLAGLRRTDRYSEDLGRLADGAPPQVCVDEHLAVLRRERVEHLGDRHRGHHRVRVVTLHDVQGVGSDHLVAVETASGAVDHEVSGHREQPAAHRALGVVQPVRVVPCADQGLLHDVLGQVVVVQQLLGVRQ